MNFNLNKATLAVAVFAAMAASGRAESLTSINTNSGEPSILSFLDTVYGAGNYERVADGLDAVWTSQDLIGAIAIAKSSNAKQQLGVCLLCDGSDDFLLGPAVTQNGINSVPLFDDTLVLGGPFFRWFDAPYGDPYVSTVYSDPLLNPRKVDQMVSFAIKDRPGVFVLGFEDIAGGILYHASDRDFNDFVVEVRFAPPPPPIDELISSVPEPTGLVLLGGALLALGCSRRFRKPKA